MFGSGLEGGNNPVIVVIRVRGSLGEPDDLLGVDALSVNDGGHLPVRPACIETNAAAVQVAANRLGAVLGRGQGVAEDHLKGVFKDVCHIVPVESLAAIGGKVLLHGVVNVLASPDIDSEPALHPEHRLHDTVDIVAVRLPVFRRTVNKGFTDRHLSASPLHGQAQGLFGVLQKRLVELVQGQEVRVQLGRVEQGHLNTKTIHILFPPSNIAHPAGPSILRTECICRYHTTGRAVCHAFFV